MIAVVILAAGESQRMGQPKALIPFPDAFFRAAAGNLKDRPAAQAKGEASLAPTKTNSEPNVGAREFGQDDLKRVAAKPKTFLEHLIEATRHPRAGVLRVVVGAHAEEIRTQVKLDDDVIVVNEEWRRGQLSSLQAAIRNLSAGKTEGILVCLVDHPLISAELVAMLIEAFERDKNKIVMPTYRGKRGHPVIFPCALYTDLLAAPEEVGARAVVRGHAADVLEVPVEEEGVVLNLNDPATLERALRQN